MYHTWGQKIIPLGACKCVKACESAWNQLQDHHHCDGHPQKPLSRHFGHLNSSTGSKVIENNVKSAWKCVKVREISCGNIAIATGSKNRGKWCTICWGKLKKFFHQNSRLEVISSVLQPETLLLPSSWALSSALSSFWINIFLFTLLYLGNEGSYQKTVKSGPPLIFRARRIGDGPAADFCQTKPNLAKFTVHTTVSRQQRLISKNRKKRTPPNFSSPSQWGWSCSWFLPNQTKPSQISSQNRESGTLKYA